MEAQQYHSGSIKKVTNVHKDLISKAIKVGCIQDKKEYNGSPSSIKTVENKSVCAEGSSAGQFIKVDNNMLARQAANIRVGDTSLTDVCQTLAPPTNSKSAIRLEMSTHCKSAKLNFMFLFLIFCCLLSIVTFGVYSKNKMRLLEFFLKYTYIK